MSRLETIPLSELPDWLSNVVALTRPLALTLTVAIPSVGSAMVGTVAVVSYRTAQNMAAVSVQFLQGIPDAAWGAITAIALGYTAAKSAEVIKAAPPPVGRASPEAGGANARSNDSSRLIPLSLVRCQRRNPRGLVQPPTRYGAIPLGLLGRGLQI